MREEEERPARRRLERLAWLLDRSIPLPGLDARIGLDPLLGLLPGVGDTLGAALGSYLLAEAARLGAPKSLLLRMAGNILFDALVGAIPVAGDLFDFAWRSNSRNLRLLETYLEQPRPTVVRSRWFVAGLGLAVAALVAGVAAFGILVFRWLWLAAGGG